MLVILEGESLFNDASALLIYRAAVGIAGTAAFARQVPGLAAAAVGSAAIGLSLGWLYMRLFARIREIATAILAQFLGVFLVWILAEKLGLSGIITLVCYALIIARIAPARTPARLRIPSYAVWEVVVFVLNILVFILVGLQLKPLLHRLHPEEGGSYLVAGGAVCITAILVRITWVMGYNTFVRWKNHQFGVRVP